MINIAELRIGNLLQLGKIIEPQGVFSIVFDRQEDWLINNVPLIHYSPIPLTPEWLAKIKMVKRHSYFESLLTRENSTLKAIKFLHQLQNFHYAFSGHELNFYFIHTGEELNVKEL